MYVCFRKVGGSLGRTIGVLPRGLLALVMIMGVSVKFVDAVLRFRML